MIRSSFLLLFSVPAILFGTTTYDTLHINHGTLQSVNDSYHYLAFNDNSEASPENHPIHFDSDTLSLTVFNNDSVSHSVSIDALNLESDPIGASENQTIELVFDDSEGVFRLYCTSARGWMLGASTSLLKGYGDATSRYFWNLFDQEHGMDTLILDGTVSQLPIAGYRPSFFSINGNTDPFDSGHSGLVQNAVGDEIILAIVNSGKMSHTLHFHGFHITILSASIDNHRAGWVKDTFNLLPGETMAVQLIPHQHGHYPVHDHNLIAINTGGYPGGMVTMLQIEP